MTLLSTKFKHKIFLTLFVLLLSVCSTLGQHINYQDIKSKYNTSYYSERVTDPAYYTMVGVACNILMPGLGQLYVDESKRGVILLGSNFIASGIGIAGMLMSLTVDESGSSVDSGRLLLYTGMGASALIQLWSIFDVVRIARLKNIAYSEQRKQESSLDIKPYAEPVRIDGLHRTNVYGLSLSISF